MRIFPCRGAQDVSPGARASSSRGGGSSSSGALSAMQVQDSSGRWQDVQLGSSEVLVLLGHSMEHATAGLLRRGVHRVVGDPFLRRRRSTGRAVLQYELRPRPAAVLDLRSQLEAVGHTVSARCVQGSCGCVRGGWVRVWGGAGAGGEAFGGG